MVTGRRPFAEDNVKKVLDLHLTRDIMNPGELIPDIPQKLQRFILNCGRCVPDQRYQDMIQAMAALKPLVQDFRSPDDSLATEKRKTSSLFLTYTDQKQPELARLVEQFKDRAREFGVDVDWADNQEL